MRQAKEREERLCAVAAEAARGFQLRRAALAVAWWAETAQSGAQRRALVQRARAHRRRVLLGLSVGAFKTYAASRAGKRSAAGQARLHRRLAATAAATGAWRRAAQAARRRRAANTAAVLAWRRRLILRTWRSWR
jgi:hypothetical protein